jgi:hypothetical protein
MKGATRDETRPPAKADMACVMYGSILFPGCCDE